MQEVNDTPSVSTSGKGDQLDGTYIMDSSDGVMQANRVHYGSGTDGVTDW
ncbi:hypothetical protein [uncultured Arthrobacter sp.]|nr:hypothetical protein [uncultured Arthrobacter sp.]